MPQLMGTRKALPRRDRQAGHHDRRRTADDGRHAVVVVPLGRCIPPHGHAQRPAHAADLDRQLCHLAVDQDAPRCITRVFDSSPSIASALIMRRGGGVAQSLLSYIKERIDILAIK